MALSIADGPVAGGDPHEVGVEQPPRLQTLVERAPAGSLASHIACLWIQQVRSTSEPYEHRTIPDGSMEIVHELGAVPKLVGPQSRPTTQLIRPGTTLVGIRFRPGAAHPLLGIPASELLDLQIPLDSVWSGAGATLTASLIDASTAADVATILSRAVIARLEQRPEIDPTIAGLVEELRPTRCCDVSAVASSLYVSERQLRRRCEAAVGVSPKTLQRILRFQRFLALSLQRPHPTQDVARLAVEAGYADQSHLSRESVRLAGLAPRALLADAEHHCLGHHDHLKPLI
jgi:AraC-like DNA-binding protein